MDRRRLTLKPRLYRLDLPGVGDSSVGEDPPKPHVPHRDAPRKADPRDYSGFVIVRLSEDLFPEPHESSSLAAVAEELDLPGLRTALDEFGLSMTRRLLSSREPRELLELERAAAGTELPPASSLTRYWRVDVREQPHQVDEVVARLRSLKEVDLAYREFGVSDPAVNPGDDSYSTLQYYLDAAPLGIDARWAWTQPNGEGAGIGFVDLEQGWFPNHEDLAGKSPTILFGDNRDGVGDYKGNHGTAVLGEVIADDNAKGVVGIAPSLASVSMVSHYDAATDTAQHVADAIVAALPNMNVGDVLLLEVQRKARGGLPVEVDHADFDAIRLAVAHGIVVVEAAGNGGDDLDAYTDDSGDSILARGSTGFRESGAILVGAANSAMPHDRASFSNYGSRVDCYGWGDSVVSCGCGDLDAGTGDDSTYTDSFNGTSSASPIVAGAAIIIQGMYQANAGSRLSPLQMRALLSDPATGTAQGTGVTGNIGVMPDLRAIIGRTLGIVPDVYLRDNLGDTGAVPATGTISASPDIIVRPATVADPQAAFGHGSGTEHSSTLGYEVEAGQDNYIYVRMRNRGGADAANVTATVYWSEVSTLVTPDMWTKVGTIAAADVPKGDTLVVAGPITWAAGEIPGKGHYCFVGVLDHPGDPAPPLLGTMDWKDFLSFIRDLNNVTWRNFNVVDLDLIGDGSAAEMPFMMAGAPDRRRVFDIEIMQQMQDGARVWLEVPLGYAKPFHEGRRWNVDIDRESRTAKMLLPAVPRLIIPDVWFTERARVRARLVVEGARRGVQPGNWIAVRQVYEREEVGRATWQFHSREDERKA